MVDDWMTLCQRLVPEILRQRDWRLVTDNRLDAFIGLVCQTILDGIVRPRPSASPEATIQRATIHRYCYELYQASGEDGTLRQRRAFEEIGQHIQGVAFRYEHNPAVVQICVQRTLEITWEKRKQVEQPGSFLGWVGTVVYYEIKGYWKKRQRRKEIPMSQLSPSGATEVDDSALERFWEKLASIPPPDDEIISHELREQLWAEVQQVFADNRRYEAVIVGYFLYELSTVALAEILQTSVSNIHVLKCRALARLRTDEQFIRRFADALKTLPGGEP